MDERQPAGDAGPEGELVPGWQRFDDLPEPWRSGFETGAIVGSHPQGPVTVVAWKLSLGYRTMRAWGWGLLWVVLIPQMVRYVREDAESSRRVTEVFFWDPLMLSLLAVIALFVVFAYRHVMAWQGVLTEH